MTTGNLDAQVRETHTGIVVLLGDRAFKAKKSIVTGFLDFSTPTRREEVCEREVTLNRRLAPDSYQGVGHFSGPVHGTAEPVIVMQRYPDSIRLASLVTNGHAVEEHLARIAEVLASFHADAARNPAIDAEGEGSAISARWQHNLDELTQISAGVIAEESLREINRLARQFISGRADLFNQRIAVRRIVDGHGDLLADDIFCVPGSPALLDCLEFDDRLRFVDGIDDAAFLAMDLEFLGRKDLADLFFEAYRRRAHDGAPQALKDFYVAYRAIVRGKVDCIRVAQGHSEAAADACRHIEMALMHLKAATVQLIVIGGGPGTGKTTLANALAQHVGAQVISTDDVRRELQASGAITGAAGDLNSGLYAPENVSLVYDEVLRHARRLLAAGSSVILDGTWRDVSQRGLAHELEDQSAVPLVELACSVPLSEASQRIRDRTSTTSDATPEIAAALSDYDLQSVDAVRIDTSRPLAESVAEAQQICCLAL